MKKYSPSDKLVVRELSLEEEPSDEDVEDDVFIRDGRTCRTYEDKNLKRPLMPPRKKGNKKNPKNALQLLKKQHQHYKKSRMWNFCEPFCYSLAAIVILIALIFFAALLLTLFPISRNIKIWFNKSTSNTELIDNLLTGAIADDNAVEQVPCTQIKVNQVWSKSFTRLNNETPVRKADLNGDKILDIIIGFGTDDSIDNIGQPQCTSSKSGITDVCGGGVLALDGITGEILWQQWTSFTVFSIFCQFDINGDKKVDCVVAGRGGLLMAIDGKSGQMIWELKEFSFINDLANEMNPILIDLYTVNVLSDLDGDGIPDIVAAHTDERENVREGHIKLISGKTGKIFRAIPSPYNEEIFVPIQVLTLVDATEVLLVITGGQNTPGGVYTIRLNSLTSEEGYKSIFRNNASGFMVPSVITDVNSDGIDDIVVSSFNSTIYAFDGGNFSVIWTYVFPSSESVSSIVPGFFNHDNVTDFMIKYNTGPGFPLYYYSQTTILNGATGESLLENKITDSGGSHSLLGGISISQTFGGDYFLHWQLQCRDKYEAKEPYTFIPDSDIVQQSRADLCRLRYNTSTVLKLNALARHVEPPGAMIFSSDDLPLQLNQFDNFKISTKQPVKQPLKHPKMRLNKFQVLQQRQQMQMQEKDDQERYKQQPIELDKKQSKILETLKQIPQFIDPPPVETHQQPQETEFLAPQNMNFQRPINAPQAEKLNNQQFLQQEQNMDPRGNLGEIKLFKKVDLNNNSENGRNVNRLGATSGKKMLQREQQLAENMESRRENFMKHQKNQKHTSFDANSENLNNMLMNKNMLLDGIQRQFAQEQGDLGLGENMIPEEKPQDYNEVYYNDEEPRYMPRGNQFPPNTRGIRSDDFEAEAPSTYETILSDLEKSDQRNAAKSKSVKKVLDLSDIKATKPQMEPRAETLWDIEIEKEANENINSKAHKNFHRKRETFPPPAPLASSATLNQNVLPSIATTGVLVESLNKSARSIDFVFVLNLRESESFPPLLLSTDIDCIEDRLSGIRTYRPDSEIPMYQKKFLKECLQSRIPDLLQPQPPRQSYETQIVITRISISCTCSDNLNPKKEVCSNFNGINKQKWSEFMGSKLDGVYSN